MNIDWILKENRSLAYKPIFLLLAALMLIFAAGGCSTSRAKPVHPKPEPLLCPRCHRSVGELLDHLHPTGGLYSTANGWLPDWGWSCCQFNEVPAPENPLVLMLGDDDLSRDVVNKGSDGQTVRVHEGWVYRFLPDGGLASITQLSSDPVAREKQTH